MRKLILALTATALAAAPATASAADYKVTGGKLDWTIANYFASGDANRTWLGYATATTGPGAASSLFAGYYLPGEPFGSVSISYITE